MEEVWEVTSVEEEGEEGGDEEEEDEEEEEEDDEEQVWGMEADQEAVWHTSQLSIFIRKGHSPIIPHPQYLTRFL